ncbi:MAG: hypothetical protein AB4063_13895, partial [Crocosphaera sp.]
MYPTSFIDTYFNEETLNSQQFFNLFNQWNDVINVEWQGITSKGFNFLKSAVYDYDLGNSN